MAHCNNCEHESVCAFKDRYQEFGKRIDGVWEDFLVAVNDGAEKAIFEAHLNCTCFKERQPTKREGPQFPGRYA